MANLEAPAKLNAGRSRGGAVALRKEKIRALAGLCKPREASENRGGTILVGLAPSSYSQIMTVIKIINT